MWRICCVENCISLGSRSRGSRYTLFQFPWSTEIRKKWLDAVGPYMKRGKQSAKRLYICALHFEEQYLEKESVAVLVDGQTKSFPRQRLSLKPKSIPSIFNGTPISNSLDGYRGKDLVAAALQCSSMSYSAIDSTDDGLEVEPVAQLHCVSSSHSSSRDSSDESPWIEPVAELKEISGEWSESNSPTDDNIQNSTYNLMVLLNDLRNSPLPIHWTFGLMPHGIVLYYMDDSLEHLPRGVLVDRAMTLQIVGEKKKLRKISCLDELLTVLNSLSKLYNLPRFRRYKRLSTNIPYFEKKP